mmetsp:Transcript_411/g.1299  ORF Transcript_411/g.1299 Transcript_411/m.1299 type:complete len:134 (+) Transcript_411:357-758(+)
MVVFVAITHFFIFPIVSLQKAPPCWFGLPRLIILLIEAIVIPNKVHQALPSHACLPGLPWDIKPCGIYSSNLAALQKAVYVSVQSVSHSCMPSNSPIGIALIEIGASSKFFNIMTISKFVARNVQRSKCTCST